MPLLSISELAAMKLSIIKNLEKTLKILYEHQYRNILSKIISNKKRFVKKSLPMDVSEDILRYNTLTYELTNYLTNLFDVFGESAVLNAKKTYGENGYKWGKKLRKKLTIQTDANEIYYYIKQFYINVPDADYMEISDSSLIWYFKKSGSDNVNEGFSKFHSAFYDIKAAWLDSFIKSFTAQYISIFEKKSEDEDEIITNIVLKEA